MARLGRENESATFTSSPTPVKRRSKSKGKDKTNADTDTSTSTSANPLDEFANEATSASKNTVAIFRDTAKGAVSANENSAEAGTSSTASPAVGPTDLEELAEDKDNRHKSDPGLDLPSSAPSSSDLYTPLLTFICEHNFMRKKQYPVLRSSRVEFVRDVNEEGKRLGYHQAVVDRVLLDIKRYYLVKVEWPHAFTEGMEFGDEFDDTPLSSVSEVSKDNGLSKDKQPEGLPLGIKFSKERQTVRDAISGSSRAPVYRYGLDPYDLSEEIYDTSPTPQKLDVSVTCKDNTMSQAKHARSPSLGTAASTNQRPVGGATTLGITTPKSRDNLDRYDLNELLASDLEDGAKPSQPKEKKRKRKRSSDSVSAPSQTSSGVHNNTNKAPKSNIIEDKSEATLGSDKGGKQNVPRSRPKKTRQRVFDSHSSQTAASKSKSLKKSGAALEDPIVLDF